MDETSEETSEMMDDETSEMDVTSEMGEIFEITLEKLVVNSGNKYEKKNDRYYIIVFLFLFLIDGLHDLGGAAQGDRSASYERGKLLIDLFVYELLQIKRALDENINLVRESESEEDKDLNAQLERFFYLLTELNGKSKGLEMNGSKKPKSPYTSIGSIGNFQYFVNPKNDTVLFVNKKPLLGGQRKIWVEIKNLLSIENVINSPPIPGSKDRVELSDILNIILLFCFWKVDDTDFRTTLQAQDSLKELAIFVHLIFKNRKDVLVNETPPSRGVAAGSYSLLEYIKKANRDDSGDDLIEDATINFAVDTATDSVSKTYIEIINNILAILEHASNTKAVPSKAGPSSGPVTLARQHSVGTKRAFEEVSKEITHIQLHEMFSSYFDTAMYMHRKIVSGVELSEDQLDELERFQTYLEKHNIKKDHIDITNDNNTLVLILKIQNNLAQIELSILLKVKNLKIV